jgi:hypothetical protein
VGAFEVSVPAVDALSFRVLTAASDIRSAEGKLTSQACVDTGYPELSGALSEFQTFWQSFTNETAGAVEGTGGNIAAAASAYQTVDSTVIADPALTSGFVSATMSGNDGLAQLLVGPMLGGPSAPPSAGASGLPGLPGLPGSTPP